MGTFGAFMAYVGAPSIGVAWLVALKMPIFQDVPDERRLRVRMGWGFTAYILLVCALIFVGTLIL